MASKPPLLLRLLLVGAFGLAASIDHNPLVKLQVAVGLSPSPLERFFGVRGMFSGMTEAAYQLAHFNLLGSVQANVLAIPIIGSIAAAILLWRVPELNSRPRELTFFATVIAASLINNIGH